jgi:hypothetical protein
MFDVLPTQITRLRGSGDAAACVDAAVGWGRVCAAAEAQRLSAIAEFAVTFLASVEEDMSLWAVDEDDDVVAQIGLAFGVSPRWAMGDLEIGAAMRDRFPELAALFLRGEITATIMSTVVERTILVTDPQALARIDADCVAAVTIAGWSGLSYYKLKNAVDVFVDRHDPGAVRRVRDKQRTRGVSVYDSDAAAGITTVAIRMTGPGAALLMGRLRRMAKTVCPNDPRTLDQRMSDAAEVLAADSDRLTCLCGSPTCPAAADDGVASRFVIHVYADTAALAAEPDPLIHGEHTAESTPTPDDASAADHADSTASDDEYADDADDSDTTDSTPRHTRASTAPERAVPSIAGEPDNCPQDTSDVGNATTLAPSAPVNPAAGIIPGFGIVPSALIAALLAKGATIHHLTPPPIDPEAGYRIPEALRKWVRARDLYCRAPGCSRSIEFCDLDR